LLRNNYLEDPALSLVKEETDIWTRLKTVYGDTKILLSNKLSELSNVKSIWRTKDPGRTAESLSKIIKA